MQRNKTDRLDARLIADFCQTQKPESWQPPSAEVKHLQSRVAESRGFGRGLTELKDDRFHLYIKIDKIKKILES